MRAKGDDKVCSKCKETKHVADFNKNRSKADGLDHECRKCRRDFQVTYTASTKGKLTTRNKQLRLYYNIDNSEYETRLAQQGGVCAICSQPPSSTSRRLHVDHDHRTGKVRGILCSKCNRGLGLFNDSQILLTAARSYLATATQ